MEKLEKTAAALRRRGFEAVVFETAKKAADYLLSDMPAGETVGFGGCMTAKQMGLETLLRAAGHKVLWHWEAEPAERPALLHEAMNAPLYVCSANAVTEEGLMVQIDGTGNRVAAMVFGPKSVVVIAGINKVVKSYEDAVARARNLAAPVNVQRFANFNPPCKNNGHCFNCTAPDSICNFILTTRKGSTMNAPAPRIKVILVGESLGY